MSNCRWKVGGCAWEGRRPTRVKGEDSEERRTKEEGGGWWDGVEMRTKRRKKREKADLQERSEKV